MYNNLNAEISRYKIERKKLKEIANIKSSSTFSLKLNGKADFTLAEAKLIKDFINEISNQNFTLDYLFQS